MEKDNLLLLHGALGSKAQLASLQTLLSDLFIVHTLDFDGHGANASNQEFSIDLFADNVLNYLIQNNIAKTHIFGYSMGGYVALKLAVKSSSFVGKIMTLGTKFNWTPEIAAKEIKMLNPQKIEEKVPAFAARLDELHTANNWKTVMQKTVQLMIDLGDGKGLSDEELRQVEQNTLIGIGEFDEMVTQEESSNAASLIPFGKFKVIDGFKHPIEKVDMKVLAQEIITFMQS